MVLGKQQVEERVVRFFSRSVPSEGVVGGEGGEIAKVEVVFKHEVGRMGIAWFRSCIGTYRHSDS